MKILCHVFQKGEVAVDVDAEEATTFQFFPSYSRASASMDAERKLCFEEAMELFGCYGVEPEFLFAGDGWLSSTFEAVRVSLDRSRKGCINGRKGGRPREKPEEELVENSDDGDGKGVLTLSEKGLKGSGEGFKPKEKKRKEKNEERKEIGSPSDQTGDGPDSPDGPATPSPEEVRAEAAIKGYVSVDLDAFMESLSSMPPGTDWEWQLAVADIEAWNERRGMDVVDVGEVV